MPHLFSTEGKRALLAILQQHPLLALDFDGTLAPIVSVPDLARVAPPITGMLQKLRQHLPVAIVSGRSVADLAGRLGFEPDYIVGNHGIEGLPGDAPAAARTVVQAWLAALAPDADELAAHGILLENKTYSLSLHYRLADDRDAALARIDQAVAALQPAPQLLGGKCVQNLMPPGMPDKFDAIRTLLSVSDRHSAIFVGDDLTDDKVFEKAPADWLTVRIEANDDHRARFHLDHQSEMALFLQRLLSALE